jgi:hypothetical protein
MYNIDVLIEIYKDIPNYQGLYQASNWGNIKSLIDKYGHKKEYILRPSSNCYYYHVILCKNGKQKTHRIHRLILETFVGPCPPGMECRHLDCNSKNNRLDNLLWGTRSDNRKDSIKNGTWFNPKPNDLRGENNPISKFKNKDILNMRKLYREGLTTGEIGKIYNTSYKNIWRIVKNKRWIHI